MTSADIPPSRSLLQSTWRDAAAITPNIRTIQPHAHCPEFKEVAVAFSQLGLKQVYY
jgi:hypothetical protein